MTPETWSLASYLVLDHSTTCFPGSNILLDHRTACLLGRNLLLDHSTACLPGRNLLLDHSTACLPGRNLFLDLFPKKYCCSMAVQERLLILIKGLLFQIK